MRMYTYVVSVVVYYYVLSKVLSYEINKYFRTFSKYFIYFVRKYFRTSFATSFFLSELFPEVRIYINEVRYCRGYAARPYLSLTSACLDK